MYILCCCRVNVFSSLELVKCSTVLERERERTRAEGPKRKPFVHQSINPSKKERGLRSSLFLSFPQLWSSVLSWCVFSFLPDVSNTTFCRNVQLLDPFLPKVLEGHSLTPSLIMMIYDYFCRSSWGIFFFFFLLLSLISFVCQMVREVHPSVSSSLNVSRCDTQREGKDDKRPSSQDKWVKYMCPSVLTNDNNREKLCVTDHSHHSLCLSVTTTNNERQVKGEWFMTEGEICE